MWPLLKQDFRHVVRTRLLFFILALTVIVQFSGLNIMKRVKIWAPGQLSFGAVLDESTILFFSLFLQLFSGSFLAAVYGIWSAPYLHKGSRAPLTFTMPIARWKFSLAYGLTMLLLTVVLHAVTMITYLWVFGWASLQSAAFPWHIVAMSLAMETLALLVVMYAFAFGTLMFGQIPTFLMGVASVMTLQLFSILFRLNLLPYQDSTDSGYWLYKIYGLLPPVGELSFALWSQFKKPSWEHTNIGLWLVWLAIFFGLLTYKLRYPPNVRSAES